VAASVSENRSWMKRPMRLDLPTPLMPNRTTGVGGR
jgi:hypothetical protein